MTETKTQVLSKESPIPEKRITAPSSKLGHLMSSRDQTPMVIYKSKDVLTNIGKLRFRNQVRGNSQGVSHRRNLRNFLTNGPPGQAAFQNQYDALTKVLPSDSRVVKEKASLTNNTETDDALMNTAG